MEFEAFATYLFYSLMSGSMLFGVRSLRELNKSVNDLNVQIAKVIQAQSDDRRRIGKLEDHVYK